MKKLKKSLEINIIKKSIKINNTIVLINKFNREIDLNSTNSVLVKKSFTKILSKTISISPFLNNSLLKFPITIFVLENNNTNILNFVNINKNTIFIKTKYLNFLDFGSLQQQQLNFKETFNSFYNLLNKKAFLLLFLLKNRPSRT